MVWACCAMRRARARGPAEASSAAAWRAPLSLRARRSRRHVRAVTSPYRGGEAPTLREPTVPLRWIAREPPLEACGLAAFGAAARALFEQFEQLAPMRGAIVAGLQRVVDKQAVAVAKRYLSFFQGPVADWAAPDQERLRTLVPERRKQVYDVRAVVVGEGARVEGSIKAHGTMHVKSRAVVIGAVTARGRIVIEDGARLSGPVISETSIIIGASVVGVASKRTTVTAPRVELRKGATVYGAVMSADGGASVQ